MLNRDRAQPVDTPIYSILVPVWDTAGLTDRFDIATVHVVVRAVVADPHNVVCPTVHLHDSCARSFHPAAKQRVDTLSDQELEACGDLAQFGLEQLRLLQLKTKGHRRAGPRRRLPRGPRSDRGLRWNSRYDFLFCALALSKHERYNDYYITIFAGYWSKILVGVC